jgi:hypothetical protein
MTETRKNFKIPVSETLFHDTHKDLLRLKEDFLDYIRDQIRRTICKRSPEWSRTGVPLPQSPTPLTHTQG